MVKWGREECCLDPEMEPETDTEVESDLQRGIKQMSLLYHKFYILNIKRVRFELCIM